MLYRNLPKIGMAATFIVALCFALATPAQALSPAQVTLISNNLDPGGVRQAAPGDIVPLYLDLIAGSDAGTQAEWWLVAYAPGGDTYSYTTSGWRAGLIPYGYGPLACFNMTVQTEALSLSGTFTFRLMIDNLIDGCLGSGALTAALTVIITGSPGPGPDPQTPPSLTIGVNGQSSTTGNPGDTVAVGLWMNPEDYNGFDAEWWIVAAAPNGDKYYYNGSAWVLDPFGSGGSPLAFGYTALIPVDYSITSPVMDLPGVWKFYFGLDDTSDNQAEMIIHDTATVTIAGEAPVLNVALTVNPDNPQMNLGGTAYLNTGVDGGDYIGWAAEAWLVAKAPDGTYYFYNGDTNTWLTGTNQRWANITIYPTMVNNNIPSPALNQWGAWLFYFVVDAAQDGAINWDSYVWAKTTIRVGGVPQLQVSCLSGQYSITEPTMPLNVTIQAGAWANTQADFWCVAVSPSGQTLSLKAGGGFSYGLDYFIQGTIANLGASVNINLKTVLTRELGTWTIYFGADPLNGYVDWNNCAYAYTTVVVY